MELKTFISQSIKDIFDGVVEAQEYATKLGSGKVNVYQQDCIRKINFDVAVTTASEVDISAEGLVGRVSDVQK